MQGRHYSVNVAPAGVPAMRGATGMRRGGAGAAGDHWMNVCGVKGGRAGVKGRANSSIGAQRQRVRRGAIEK